MKCIGFVLKNTSPVLSTTMILDYIQFMQTRIMFISLYRVRQKLSEEYLSTIISECSERFINEDKLCTGKFKWQDSAAAFSVSKADVNKVCK
jgi:hypothetical protein